MAPSRAEQIVERLRNMQAAAPDIEASAVVSVDGLIMASALQQGVEEDRVSAMSAAMLSLGERISGELGRGVLEQVYIKGETRPSPRKRSLRSAPAACPSADRRLTRKQHSAYRERSRRCPSDRNWDLRASA